MPATARPSRKRRWIAVCISTLLLILFLAWEGFSHKVLEVVEKQILTTGPNGPQTPATFGTPYRHVFIWSDRREPQATARVWKLDANLVTAPASCGPDAPAVLLFHGTGETISDWANAQHFLYNHCVSSLVFDPTGSGNSPRPATIDDINADALHAYTYFAQRFSGRRLYVLGHSLGNAFMLPAAANFSPAPVGLIEANGFASLHSIAGEGKSRAYRMLIDTTPDWLDNVKAVSHIRTPILVIVSDADTRNPMHNGLSIFAAAPEPKQLVTLHGFGHNDLYKNPTDEWWSAALTFMHVPPSAHVEH
jgi:pimeloyl-ACP methyl ester carboxylesterase